MSKKLTLIAYSVKDRGEGQKAIWTRIGAVSARQRSWAQHSARRAAARRSHRPHRAERKLTDGARRHQLGARFSPLLLVFSVIHQGIEPATTQVMFGL